MKKLIAILMLAVMLISCSSSTEVNASNTNRRFKFIQRDPYCDVIVDTETGVEYAFSTGAYNYGSMTVLVDENGKPLTWEGDLE